MNARLFVKRNASTILTVLGSIGVVATTIASVKAIPKALRLIEEAKTRERRRIDKMRDGQNSRVLLDQSYKDYRRILNSHKLHCL